MADEKQFSESEHLAILADRVTTETQSITAERDQLATQVTDLQTKLDVAESARVAAEAKATEVETEFEGFKTEVQTEREAAARKDERLKQAKDVATHLDEKFFEDEDRVKRIVAMSEEDFTAYVADLGATSTVKTTTTAPRETAMQLGGGDQSQPKESAARGVLISGRYSASKEG